MPHTRPRITFNIEGVAMHEHNEKRKIRLTGKDGRARNIMYKYRDRNKGRHNVLVPYSGERWCLHHIC